MGAAKTGGNYASSLLAQQEATAQGCDQVVFLDAQEGKYVEELGGMNMYFVYDDGRIVTPEVGTILEGITRGSHHRARRQARPPGRGAQDLASTSGARASPAARSPRSSRAAPPPSSPRSAALKWDGGEVGAGATETGPVTMQIRQALVDIQYGRAEDTFGWMHRIVC